MGTTAPDPAPADTAANGTKASPSTITGLFYKYLYVSPAQLDTVTQVQDTFAPFESHRGKIIRKIHIRKAGVFQAIDARTADPSDASWLERFGSTFHLDTRDWVIRSFYLMKEGDTVDPQVLAETERQLRDTQFIQAARIEVLPIPESPDSVDVLVATRDVFSLGASVKIKKTTAYSISLFDRNFLGLGHNIQSDFGIDTRRSPQPLDYSFIYGVSNVRRSYMGVEFRYDNLHTRNRAQLIFNRDYVFPRIRTAGALRFRYTNEKSGGMSTDGVFPNSRIQEIWLGRALRLGELTYLTPAGRVNHVHFKRRPDVSATDNRGFQNRTELFANLSLSRNQFHRGRLIFQFGQAEDVPVGYILSVTGGYSPGEFADRPYAGMEVRGARYSDSFGYIQAGATVGTFWHDGKAQDGVLHSEAFYFTNLTRWGRYLLRQYLRTAYTRGLGREENDNILLDEDKGVRWLDNDVLLGKQRLFLNYQAVLFPPWNLYGFRLQLFGTADVGTIGRVEQSLLDTRYWSSLGFGVRIKNEHLVFRALQIRFTYFPSLPEGVDPARFDVGSFSTVTLPDYLPGEPRIPPYD